MKYIKISQSVAALAFCAFAASAATAGLRQDLSDWQGGRPPVGACMIAWDECRILAKDGNARAQYLVGYAYSMGLRSGVGGSTEAVKWLERAAYQRMPPAMLMLGRLYREGDGTAKNLVQAAMWFELAAKFAPDGQVQASANYELGEINWSLSDDQKRDVEIRTSTWLQQNSADVAPPLPAHRPNFQSR